MSTLCLCGAGKIGSIHLKNISESKDAQVTAIVETSEQRTNQLRTDGYAVYSTLTDALNAHSFDAIVIASPPDTHPDLINIAATAGKGIFCEKPLGHRLSSVEECLIEVARANVPLVVGFNRRFDPAFAELHRRLRSGAIGKVEMVFITSREPHAPSVEEQKHAGGFFYDLTIHDMDTARWLLGEEPTEVYTAASCLTNPLLTEAEEIDTAMITLKTASGKLCHINNSRRTPYGFDQRLEIHGAEGVLKSREIFPDQQSDSGAPELPFFQRRYKQSYKKEIEHFIKVLQGQVQPIVSGEDGLRALLLAEAAHESYTHGCAVDARQLTPL